MNNANAKLLSNIIRYNILVNKIKQLYYYKNKEAECLLYLLDDIIKFINRRIIGLNLSIDFTKLKDIVYTTYSYPITIYSYKICNTMDNNNMLRFKYINGMDVLIYRKQLKTQNKIIILTHHNIFKGERLKIGYDITKIIESKCYKIYNDIRSYFNNNIKYLRGIFVIRNCTYSMEKIFIHIIDNNAIFDDLELYVYNDYSSEYIKNIPKSNEKTNVIYIDKEYIKPYILLNYKKVESNIVAIKKNKTNNTCKIEYNNISLDDLILFYYYDNIKYVTANGTLFSDTKNEEHIIKLDINTKKYYIFNYKIYHIKNNIEKLLIFLGSPKYLYTEVIKYKFDDLLDIIGINNKCSNLVYDGNKFTDTKNNLIREYYINSLFNIYTKKTSSLCEFGKHNIDTCI